MSTKELYNHYDILGISANATPKEIKKSFRALSRSLHPDKNTYGTALFRRVCEAYEVLSDPVTRKSYDRDPNTVPASGPNGCRATTDGMLNTFSCPVCNDTVRIKFVELTCCGRLCCMECIKTQTSHCPSCQKGLTKSSIRRKSNKFVKKLIEQVAIPHACGRYVCLTDVHRHSLVCPAQNTVCFKCSGKGRFYSPKSDTMLRCDGCHGLRVLPGLDWRLCFKCNGRGALEAHSDIVVDCETCDGKGGLQGHWTMCFKCQGKGSNKSRTGSTDCTACGQAGTFQGFNLEECAACKGYGCDICKYRGCRECQCGPACKGHSSSYTPRYVYASYDSDSSEHSTAPESGT